MFSKFLFLINLAVTVFFAAIAGVYAYETYSFKMYTDRIEIHQNKWESISFIERIQCGNPEAKGLSRSEKVERWTCLAEKGSSTDNSTKLFYSIYIGEKK